MRNPKVGEILIWYGKPVGRIIEITDDGNDNIVYKVKKLDIPEA